MLMRTYCKSLHCNSIRTEVMCCNNSGWRWLWTGRAVDRHQLQCKLLLNLANSRAAFSFCPANTSKPTLHSRESYCGTNFLPISSQISSMVDKVVPYQVASLISLVGSMVSLLTRWYWVRIPVGLALHLISPHPRVCKLWPEWFPTHKQ